MPILKEKAPRTCWQEVGHCQRTDSWPPLSGVPWPASIFLPGRRSPKSQEKPQQRLLIIMQLVGHLFLSTLTFTISRSISFLPPCLAWPPPPLPLPQPCLPGTVLLPVGVSFSRHPKRAPPDDSCLGCYVDSEKHNSTVTSSLVIVSGCVSAAADAGKKMEPKEKLLMTYFSCLFPPLQVKMARQCQKREDKLLPSSW